MMKYLKSSLLKLKKDALSKVFYDLIKYLFITFGLVFILKFIPVVKEIFKNEFSFSLWQILLISLGLITLSLVVSIFIFNKKIQELKSESQIDELTGLKNYKALDVDFQFLENERNDKDEPISLILIDIDNFKTFNEDNSYEVADRILTKLGNLLDKDSRISDEVYRYFMRGDEFLIVAKQTTISNAQIASERKRKLIQDSTFSVDGSNFNLTVSCGVTEFSKGDSKEQVLERVNQALQNAKKKSGKNNTEILI